MSENECEPLYLVLRGRDFKTIDRANYLKFNMEYNKMYRVTYSGPPSCQELPDRIPGGHHES